MLLKFHLGIAQEMLKIFHNLVILKVLKYGAAKLISMSDLSKFQIDIELRIVIFRKMYKFVTHAISMFDCQKVTGNIFLTILN